MAGVTGAGECLLDINCNGLVLLALLELVLRFVGVLGYGVSETKNIVPAAMTAEADRELLSAVFL